MSDSTKKLLGTKFLGLAALATAFAGLSYGQVITCNAALSPTSNPTLRAEGETELVADVTAANCSNTSATATTGGQVVASVSAIVTSRSASSNQGNTQFAGNSDVVLQLTNGAGTSYYPGTANGPTITFANVSYPSGAFTLTVSNVRVNASAASNPQITEGLLVEYPVAGSVNPSNLPVNAVNVGYVLPSLSTSIVQNASNQNQFFSGTSSSFQTCAGVGLSSSSLNFTAFTLNIKELTANAFKTMVQENGSFVASNIATLSTNTGLATQATQLQLTLTNVPSAATIYLPVTLTSGGTTLALQGSVSALTSPSQVVGLGLVNSSGMPVTGGPGVFGFTPSAGVVTATYTTTTNAGTGTNFYLPVYFTVSGGAAPVQATAMTALVSYSPTATVTGPTGLIPTFAPSTTSPINTLTVTGCTTTLLFPYVTNASGFETGIAIANTTTDNLKSSSSNPAGVSSITASSGTCTLNFYGGTATQPTAFTTPTFGAYSTTNTSGPVYANTLSSLSGATGFSGYAIASCNFLDAHGFAYIVDNFGTASGTAEGYLAVVLPSGRAGTGDGINTGN